MRSAAALCIGVLVVILASAMASRADQFDIISFEHPSANVEIVHINQPNPQHPITQYPSITFLPGDQIVVTAGGCVQTGGWGDTWKRYVNPSGDESEKYYFGEIWIPGVTEVMEPIQGVVNKQLFVPAGSPSNLFLRLGYSDDGYGDNNYDNHDNGNDNQCGGQDGGSAWVVLTITHNATPPQQTALVAPFDLFWNQVDGNGIPFQAIWGESINNKLDPADHPNPFPSDDICATPWLNPCTTQAPSIDNAPWPNTWVSCDHLGGPLVGHVNWGPGTYQGSLSWESKSDAGADDDYSLNLATQNAAGATSDRPQGYHIEFDSDETVDNFSSTWWDGFHTLVDENEKDAADEVKDRFTIVTGLVDLDCAHPCGGELHPVYAIFIRENGDPGDETWEFFVRNWGNEGGCASDDHQLFLDSNRYTVMLPWFPNATSVSVGENDIDTNGDVTITGPTAVAGVGVEIDFQMPDPGKHASVDGTFHLTWATSGSARLRPPVAVLPARFVSNGNLRATAASRMRLGVVAFGGARDDQFPPMTESQRSVYFAHLPPVVRHRDTRKIKLGPVHVMAATDYRLRRMRIRRTVPNVLSVFDQAKHARDEARVKALLAAFGGAIPGQQLHPYEGISGSSGNPPPH